MIDTTNTINATNTIGSVGTDFPPETTEFQTEQRLEEEIGTLWASHLNAKHTVRATNDELRTLRSKLGEHLHELKGLLAKPGRDGQWSGFLREHEIPRATADRIVERYQRSLNPDLNCVTEADSPTEEQVDKVFKNVWPKLRGVLKTPQSFHHFIALLTSHCEFQTTNGEIEPVGSTIFPAVVDEEPTVKPEFVTALVAGAHEEVN
jgi:hypothetical protein